MVEEENQLRMKNKYKSITFSANRESQKSLRKGQLLHLLKKTRLAKAEKLLSLTKGKEQRKNISIEERA